MNVKTLLNITGADFFTGVPDSQLKPLCDYLMDTYGTDPKHHVIAANEGNCAALAAGYHLSTGKIPAVYMQNSGIGNSINPLASLLHEKVYAIPCIFLIGWRGEPGIPDEPQHLYQGEVTLQLLEDMGIEYFVLKKETLEESLQNKMNVFKNKLAEGKDVAFVVCTGALSYEKSMVYTNPYSMPREEVIRHIARFSGEDLIVSTTGKASRELYEIREASENNEGNHSGNRHKKDFLTVGSMGHSSSIALGIALQKPDSKIWCIDGDGAVLMHMGAMAVIGQTAPDNLIHIVINNSAHESVGGMPTAAGGLDFQKIAEGCGYKKIFIVSTYEELDSALKHAKEERVLTFIEVKTAIGARENLGRPTTPPKENKQIFMQYMRCP